MIKLYQHVWREPDNPAAGFGGLMSEFYIGEADFLEHMEAQGYALRDHLKGGPCREELQGEPRLMGDGAPYGPMWGGHNPDGRVIVRYESPEAYNLLSM